MARGGPGGAEGDDDRQTDEHPAEDRDEVGQVVGPEADRADPARTAEAGALEPGRPVGRRPPRPDRPRGPDIGETSRVSIPNASPTRVAKPPNELDAVRIGRRREAPGEPDVAAEEEEDGHEDDDEQDGLGRPAG